MIGNEQIKLFCSLFKGREDVFALRWEKSTKSGYMPAYSYDPYMYRLHKQKGGTFKNYKDKSYLKLDDYQVAKHLNGQHFIGIYPLLKNNTSWFIIADFDKKDWQEQCKKAVEVCEKNNIPAYLERSRSGNGGHVWVFFDKPYPAIRSRKIIMSLFESSGIFSVFDKNTSFDRLFPNQDFLSGKGFGNLIALPLHKKSLTNGNTCFVDVDTLEPFENQWDFLKKIKRTSTDDILDSIFLSISESANIVPVNNAISNSGKLQIILNSTISLNRSGLTPALVGFLKNELNFYNTDYIVKKKMGRNTWQTERYFKFIEETENNIILPRGFVGKLLRFCIQNSIEHKFIDERKKINAIDISSTIHLLEHQESALEITSKKDFGIIVSPPGSGKTIIGLKIIEQKKQPALIIVHRKQIAEQWIERIETFFRIPKRAIGKIGQGKTKVGEKVTVALIQTLAKKLNNGTSKELISAFGTIIIDECHHIPAKSFREVLNLLNPYYQYGLTATPFRKNNDEKLMFIYIGDTITEIKPHEIQNFKKARIIVQNTKLNVPFDSKTDHFETLSKILIHDSERNKLILKDVKKELNSGRKAVIITERKEHIQALYQYLKNAYEVIAISGEDSTTSRNMKRKNIQEGNYQAIITTGQYFGEGTDIQNVSCLFLVYPFSFKGKLIQYIGRVQRSELTPIIYDYKDIEIPYLNNLFLKRNVHYRHLDKQATLFDDNEIVENKSIDYQNINKTIRIAIQDLDFHYGMVCFSYTFPQINAELLFEIENENIQPEFDVLKPYFSKILHSKFVSIHIQIEFENKNIISKIAISNDIDSIDKEIIESVKFQFVQQKFIRNLYGKSTDNQATENELAKNVKLFFDSENDLLETILKNTNIVHYKHLLYLAKHHEYKILKIRFTLHPFSFVFLLSGEQKYHVVLETLDTKEATYIWHIRKNKDLLKMELEEVNCQLNTIRNNGRQLFLEKVSENFSRLIHDYNDDKKGFYKWKNALEERLI